MNNDNNNSGVNVKDNLLHNTPITSKYVNTDEYLERHGIKQTIGEMVNSLLHELDPDPFIYMVRYLSTKVSDEELSKNGIDIPPPYPKGRPIVKYPNLLSNNTTLLAKYLNKDNWELMKYRKTKYGGNINNITIINDNIPLNQIGCIISDGESIKTFKEILAPIISEVHKIEISDEDIDNTLYEDKFKNEYELINKNNGDEIVYDELNNYLISFSISLNRNLAFLPFNQYLSQESREYIDKIFNREIISLITLGILPPMRTLNYIADQYECDSILKKIKFNEEILSCCNMKQNWPYSRSIYTNEDNSIVILINFIDHFHLNIISAYPKVDMASSINKAFNIIKYLNRNISFEFSKRFGNITTQINQFGAGLRLGGEITLKNIHKNQNINLNKMFNAMGFDSFSFKPEREKETKLLFEKWYKLQYKNIDSFIKDFIYGVCGIAKIDRNEGDFDQSKFERKTLKENPDCPSLNEVYEKCFEDIKYKFAYNGNNINDIIINNEIVLFSEKKEYDSFFGFTKILLLKEQGFDVGKYEHIHKEDLDNKSDEDELNFLFENVDNSQNEDSFNYNEKVTEIIISLRRNIEGIAFPWKPQIHPINQKEIKEDVNEENESDESNNFSLKLEVNKNKISYDKIKEVVDAYNDKSNEEISLPSFIIHEGQIKISQISNETDKNVLNIYDTYCEKYNIDVDNSYNGVLIFPSNCKLNAPSTSLFGIINNIDHLKFIYKISPSLSKIGQIKEKHFKEGFSFMLSLINSFSQYLPFIYDINLGFVTANPMFLGTGMTIKVKMRNLSVGTMKHLDSCSKYISLGYVKVSKLNSNSIALLTKRTIGISEVELFSKMKKTIRDILNYDSKINSINTKKDKKV